MNITYHSIFWQQIQQQPALRWGGSFVFIVGVHISVIAAALYWQPSVTPSSTPPMAAIMVDLAPVPLAPDTPENARDTGPVQKEVPPPPIPEPEPEIEPLPELPVIEKAQAILPPKPEPIDEPPEPVEQELPAQQDSAPPAIEAPPAPEPAAPMDGAVSLLPSQATATWQSVLLGHLEQHKRYPRLARRNRQEAIVYVRVSINRDGTVIDYRLERPSTYEALNRETLALIARAQPLPPPPQDTVSDIVEFVVPVEFFLRR